MKSERPPVVALSLSREELVKSGAYECRAAAVRAGIEAITKLESQRRTDRAEQRPSSTRDPHDQRYPTELRLGADDGMPTRCVTSFDNLRVVPKAYLVDQICEVRPARLAEAFAVVQAAIDC